MVVPFLLGTLGLSHLVCGVGALDQRFFYGVPEGGGSWMTRHDITGWGAGHLVFGAVLLALAGWAAVAGGRWLRTIRLTGIGLALVSALASLLFMAYHPFWAVVTTALDVAVIVALTRTRAPRTRRHRSTATSP